MRQNEIHDFAKELWPINRSLTGEGVRETLKKIKKILPNLEIKSLPTGTKVFDWEIPKEWNVKEAYILKPNGEKICDYQKNNLHLVGYSIFKKSTITYQELDKHLHSLPDQPNAIPYVTSYYDERWGFCISHNERLNLEKDGLYKVVIDSSLSNGELNYGELIIKGKSTKEIFLSTYICHPSMANNELSGPCVLSFIGKWINEKKNNKYNYRIIFIPETIGSIAYLSLNYKEMQKKIFAGFNVSCIGDDRSYSYLPSRKGNTISDKVAMHILNWTDPKYKKYSWLERGSDERQYCAPGIDLPIASIMRTKYGEYPEYHTSLDNLIDVVTPSGLNGGFKVLQKAINLLENYCRPQTKILCEPQMGKRGLYPTISKRGNPEKVKLMMDCLSLCDGENSIIEISDKLNIASWELYETLNKLKENNIIN